MARLVAVQKMLKSLDIEFTYEEKYRGGEISEITFKDSLGNDHLISNYPNSRLIYVKGYRDVDNQKEVIEWIKRNKTLLTDKEATLKFKEEKEATRREIEEERKIVQEWSFEKEGYTLRIGKRKNGYLECRLTYTKNNERRFMPEIYVKKHWLEEDSDASVVIQTTSYGSLTSEEAKEFMTEFQKGFEAMNYFNGKLNEISNKNNN